MGTESTIKKGFLLHTFYRTRQNRSTVYGIGKLSTGESFGLVDRQFQPTCYVYRTALSQVENRLKSASVRWNQSTRVSMEGQPLIEIRANTVDQLKRLGSELEAIGVPVFEADIPLAKSFLIENRIHGPLELSGNWQTGKEVDWVIFNPNTRPIDWEPELSILSIDIETNREATLVTAASVVAMTSAEATNYETVLVLGNSQPDDPEYVQSLASERELLLQLSTIISQCDPDIITGWNVIDFDFKVLAERYKAHHLPFTIGRSKDSCYYQEGSVWGGSRVVVFGRQVMDAMHLARFTLTQYDDYRLDTVARTLLGRGKLLETNDHDDMAAIIEKTRTENPKLFADYCLEDARLVLDILNKVDLIRLSLKRCILTGLPLDNAWGSVAAFEFLYLSELHRKNIVNTFIKTESDLQRDAPGGFVFSPLVGVHNNVFVFDFKSLYPSIIRTFNIDPLAMVMADEKPGGEAIVTNNGVRFDRARGILPEMLDIFFDRRAGAKAEDDALASYTYKIVMNSFYGVLGTNTCRFSSSRLAGAITYTGHYLLHWSKELLEKNHCRVLYGDTDSLFVDAELPENVSYQQAFEKGEELCELINSELTRHLETRFGVESRLEMEFEKIYKKLLLPPMRGQETRGRAKGYAGLLQKNDTETELQIVGMEAARRDWTKLSHQFQRELLALLFNDADTKEIETYIFNFVHEIHTGTKDDQLVYRKALRKPVESYVKTTPPHVKAARMLPNPPGVIHYVMTIDGPHPVNLRSAPIDYNHYVEKQIKPIIETIAPFCNVDIHAALTGQQRLF